MIEDSKLAEWRQNVEARRAFGWAVVQQLLEEVTALRAQLAQSSQLTVVELPADCPVWRGERCLAAGAPRAMRAGYG